MKILVTGGSGFIGSNFIIYWLKAHPEDEIINIDKLTYAADPENLRSVSGKSNYRFVKGDITNLNLMDELVSDAECIVNFAAESHVDNSIKNSDEFIKSNIVGVHTILELVRKYGVRFHQISTDEVYGSLSPDSEDVFSEGSCYNPRNPYSATKASADFLVRSYYNTYGLPVTISNCSNNYGPNQHPEKLIPMTILNFMQGKPIKLYGDGKQIRDWIFVEDHCSAVESVVKWGRYGETYLISSENEVRNIDLVNKIKEFMQIDADLIEHIKDRPGHDVRYALNPSKIMGELGWSPKFTLDEGLLNTIQHYKSNSKRYISKMAGKNQ